MFPIRKRCYHQSEIARFNQNSYVHSTLFIHILTHFVFSHSYFTTKKHTVEYVSPSIPAKKSHRKNDFQNHIAQGWTTFTAWIWATMLQHKFSVHCLRFAHILLTSHTLFIPDRVTPRVCLRKPLAFCGCQTTNGWLVQSWFRRFARRIRLWAICFNTNSKCVSKCVMSQSGYFWDYIVF